MPSQIFQPAEVGNLTLSHRIVLAPLTRFRADSSHALGELAVEYYTQRASVPGTLLISEGSMVAPQAGAVPHIPHIYTPAQVREWKRVADAVHAKGSFIYMQLWALGRADYTMFLKSEDPGFDLVGASNIPIEGKETPRPLTVAEIEEYVNLYRDAAHKAVHEAGFDGVEIHNANGYLLDQFLQDTSNDRTDQYGGSVENRCRFPLAVVDAVTKAVGQERTGIRVSPWSRFQDMRMKDPKPTFSHFISTISQKYPKFSYLHVVEPRISGPDDENEPSSDPSIESNDFLREIWQPRPLISAGNYTRTSAMERADKTGELIAFGRAFISNPDLPLRLKKDIPLTAPDRSTFYTPESPKGYTDYPFAPLTAVT